MTKHKILVVDDEKSLYEILQFNLEVEGYEVDTAYSAEQALSTMYGFRPALSAAFLNVASCIRGEHEQTTTPVSFFSLMAS